MTIFDSRSGGGGGSSDSDDDQGRGGGDFGPSSPMETRPAKAGGGSDGDSRYDDPEDVIPF